MTVADGASRQIGEGRVIIQQLREGAVGPNHEWQVGVEMGEGHSTGGENDLGLAAHELALDLPGIVTQIAGIALGMILLL
jgi:hypothetical protein